ncbi:MAG: hypothetical protein AAGA56_25555 [Myxococcota bacterium]
MNCVQLDDLLRAVGPQAAVFYSPQTGRVHRICPFRRPPHEGRRPVEVVVRPPQVVIETTCEVLA